MDLPALASLTLPDAEGVPRRLGDRWADRPVVLVFLRHFGWLHCRAHAAQLRRSYPEITELGADVVAVGTGSVRYAAAFVKDEDIPFPVLVDDNGDAADAASVRRANWLTLAGPKSWPGTVRVWREGHRIHTAGRRVTQLGATFVIGPGDTVRFEHHAGDSSDHAPVADILAVLRRSAV